MSKSMKILTATAVLAAMLAAPLASVAQDAPKKPAPAAKAAPAAKPAPAARPAAPPPRPAAQARPAPPPRPAPAARVAPPHPAPQRAAAPPRPAPQRSAAPIRQAPPVNRAVREEHRQQRIQTQPATAARPNIQTQPTTAARPNIQAQPNVQSKTTVQAQPLVTTPQQQRAERALRRRENSELRRLPPQQRAARREEIQRARQQRALGTQQAQPNALTAQPKALTAQPNTLQTNVQRTSRRNGQARVTTQAAQQGRFAARLASAPTTSSGRTWRGAHMAAHRAWRRGLRAGFVPWYGPVFWPYAYSDVFDYAFWPDGYDDGFWDYAYDDFVDGLFWGEAGPPVDYVYAPSEPITRATPAAVQELCRQPGSGITAWPFAEIEQKVGLNAEQKQLLADVRKAGSEAAAVFKASCPPSEAFPLTPPGRLQAMTARLQATQQAVQTVRPALEKFYDSLSDEQKERFNEIGPKKTASNAEASAAQDTKNCKEPKAGLSNLPIEKIEDAVKPTDAQEDALNKLEDATNKAVSILQAACPDETPLTPPGRLQAMEKRLTAMIEAANTVKPELENFYASLSSEQKARFNRIGQQLETTGSSGN